MKSSVDSKRFNPDVDNPPGAITQPMADKSNAKKSATTSPNSTMAYQPGQVEEKFDKDTEHLINKSNQFVFYYMGKWFSIASHFTLAASAIEVYFTVTQLQKAFSQPNSDEIFQKSAHSILKSLMPVMDTTLTAGTDMAHDITGTGKWLLRGIFSYLFVAHRIDRIFLPMQYLGKMIREGDDLKKFAIVPLTKTPLSDKEAKDQCDEVRLSICIRLFAKICGLVGACMAFNRAPSMHDLFVDASFYHTTQQIFDEAGSMIESLPGLSGVKQTLVLKCKNRGASRSGRGILVTVLTFASIFFTWLMENPKHTWAQLRKLIFYTSVVPILVTLGVYGLHHFSEFLIKTGRRLCLKADSKTEDKTDKAVDKDELETKSSMT